MINGIIKQMIDKYQIVDGISARKAIREIMQEITLCGLYRSFIFNKISFYGGTCLRIFFGIDRFSEDLDFSTDMPDQIDLRDYKSYIDDEFGALGLNVTFEIKEKSDSANIKRGYVRGNAKELFVAFGIDEKIINTTNHNEEIKVKLEIDSNAPFFAGYDIKAGLLPYPYAVRTYDIESLFAGKISAVLCRGWKSRVKGRDLYDYCFYLSKDIAVNLKCVEARIMHDGIELDHELTLEELKKMLCDKFDLIDYEKAKLDMLNFIDDKRSLDLWNKEFFKSITQNLKSSENHIFRLPSDEEIELCSKNLI